MNLIKRLLDLSVDDLQRLQSAILKEIRRRKELSDGDRATGRRRGHPRGEVRHGRTSRPGIETDTGCGQARPDAPGRLRNGRFGFPQRGTDLAPGRDFMVLSANHVSPRQSIAASRPPSDSLSALGRRIGLWFRVSVVPW